MIELTTIFILIASILIVVKSADLIIKSTSNMAAEFGVTEYFIGFAVVAIGTSLPELVTAIFGSIAKQSNLILGNLIGANIIDATLVLGLMAIIGRRIKIEGSMFRTFDETLFMTLGIVLLPLILGLNGRISRLEGIILLLAFGFYIFRLIKREETFRHKKHIIIKEIRKDIILFCLALPLLLLSARFLVSSAVEIASALNISTYIIGITVIALGTTIPELTVETRAILKGKKGIGFGTVIGSIITNISLVLGIAALINPIVFTQSIFITAGLFMITSTFVALLFLQKKEVTWKEGMALVLIYLTFILSEVIIV
tara:strand:- start:44 stop:985 length:942 start_codon:yes stop_codon:yes gene_type:complete